MGKKRGLTKFIAGAALGGALGVLFAPKKGSESRQDLKNKASDALEKVKNADYEEVKNTIEEKFANLKQEIADLDKEKVLNVAKKKANDLKQQANEIVNYAIKKGTPVVQKAAEDAKEKAIELLNATIQKLENKEQQTTKKPAKTTKKK